MSTQGLSTGVKAQMIIWALFMPVCLVLAIWAFLPDADKDADFNTATVEAQKLRTVPVGQVAMPGAPAATDSEQSVAAAPPPKETYEGICAACHATGLLESPKFGDTAEWEKRIAAVGGFEKLVASAIAGKGSMPPKGGAGLADEDFAKVVAYLSGQSGGGATAEAATTEEAPATEEAQATETTEAQATETTE